MSLANEDEPKGLSRHFLDCLRFFRAGFPPHFYTGICLGFITTTITIDNSEPLHGRKSAKKRRDSDGNLVNVGNFDADGANVNRNRPGNHNDNLGVAFSRSLFYLEVLIQPPSILPISMTDSESCKNF